MKYKYLLPIFIAGVALMGFVVYLLTQQPPAAEGNCSRITSNQTVIMKEDSFEPENLTIQKCTRVVFENQDTHSRWPASNLHPTHGIYPEFDPQQAVMPKESWSFIFDKAGKWRYHDHLIPTIKGEIQVNE